MKNNKIKNFINEIEKRIGLYLIFPAIWILSIFLDFRNKYWWSFQNKIEDIANSYERGSVKFNSYSDFENLLNKEIYWERIGLGVIGQDIHELLYFLRTKTILTENKRQQFYYYFEKEECKRPVSSVARIYFAKYLIFNIGEGKSINQAIHRDMVFAIINMCLSVDSQESREVLNYFMEDESVKCTLNIMNPEDFSERREILNKELKRHGLEIEQSTMFDFFVSFLRKENYDVDDYIRSRFHANVFLDTCIEDESGSKL